MTVIEALQNAQEAVVRILKKAKLVDGSELDEDQLKGKKEKRVMFWYRQAPLYASSRELFVIWAIPSLEPVAFGDNRVAVRDAYVSIDFYSKNGEYDEKTLQLMARVAKEFENHEWRFEKVALDSIDYVEGLTQIRYKATKKI